MGMASRLDGEVAFQDLTHSFEALQEERSSPVQVRRLFVDFLRFAVQLPWILEKEFKAITGEKPSYKGFWDTNGVTKCCKALRHVNEHDLPVRLKCDETISASQRDLVGPRAPAGRRLSLRAEGQAIDPLTEELSPGIGFYLADADGAIDLTRPVATKRRTDFVIDATTERIKRALALAPTADVHDLSATCYSSLKALYEGHSAGLAQRI